jgi:general secretion pathway protein D
MKNIVLLLICFVLFSTLVPAAEGQKPPQPERQSPSVTPQPAPDTNDIPSETMKKIQNELPEGIPDSPVTPEQIKAFLSKPKEDNYIILNFDNADLKDVINTVGSITNENFILGPGLDARVTIHSAKKIPVSEVMNVFESVLEANGMAVVRSGEFIKIVSATTAKQKPIEVRTGNQSENIPDIDRVITQIVPVQYVPAAEVSTVLSPMLSQFGSIVPNPRNNLLIVNEVSSNLIRLLKVLKEIDVNAFKNTRMSFFKPKYSDVLSLSNELTEVLNALNLTREGIVLVPIERINSLVVFSGSPTLLKTVEGWIKKLDEEVMTGQNIFVYPVQNVEAGKIADILTTLYATDNGTAPKVTARKTQTKTKKTPAASRSAISSKKALSSSGNSRIEIITFEPTNSLVILSPPGVYRDMVKTVQKLDVYPREVLIEAIIAQVSLSDADQYGVQWSVLNNLGNDYQGLGLQRLSNAPSLSSAITPRTTGSEVAGEILDDALDIAVSDPSGISYIVFKPEKLLAMIHALSSKSKVNILQSPRLLVRDQEEANIEVGSDIPTATSTTAATTTDTLTQNIEYRTVGIKLKIKPTISEDKTVVLDIEQEVSSEGDNIQVGSVGTTFPSFDLTKTKTSIVVPDKQAIVIGGIMEETKGNSYEGIPILSELPILGPIFRYSIDDSTKKELIIIITPHVVTSKSEGSVLTQDFLKKLEEVKAFLSAKETNIFNPIPGKE